MYFVRIACLSLALSVLVGCQSEPDDSGSPISLAEPVDQQWATDDVIQGWKKVGATVGAFAPLGDGPLGFPRFLDAAPGSDQLPGFAVDGPIDLTNLKDPGVPFGLMWSGATSEQLQNISHLENLAVLELMIEDFSAANLEDLASLKNLTSLSIFHAGFGILEPESVDAGMTHLSSLTRLEGLKLTSVNVDAGLQHLIGLENLTSLDLYSAKVTDLGLESVGQLHNLKGLDLSGTAVTDVGLAHLAELSQLLELKLDRTATTPAGVETLRAELPNCTLTRSE